MKSNLLNCIYSTITAAAKACRDLVKIQKTIMAANRLAFLVAIAFLIHRLRWDGPNVVLRVSTALTSILEPFLFLNVKNF